MPFPHSSTHYSAFVLPHLCKWYQQPLRFSTKKPRSHLSFFPFPHSYLCLFSWTWPAYTYSYQNSSFYFPRSWAIEFKTTTYPIILIPEITLKIFHHYKKLLGEGQREIGKTNEAGSQNLKKFKMCQKAHGVVCNFSKLLLSLTLPSLEPCSTFLDF